MGAAQDRGTPFGNILVRVASLYWPLRRVWDPSRKAKYLAFIDLDQLTFPLLHCRKLHVSLKLEEEFASYGGWKAVE